MIRMALLVVVFCLTSKAANRCGGGDGPHPVEGGDYKTDVVDTKGGINEFVYFKDRNVVVYRNGKNEILDVVPGMLNYPKSASNNLFEENERISRVADPFERFVAVEGKWKVYDTTKDTWIKGDMDGPVKHLFWKGDSLYGMRASKIMLGKGLIEFFKMSTRTGKVELNCSIREKVAGSLHLVQGQYFPDAHFVSLKRKLSGETLISSYRFDVRNCNAVEVKKPLAEVASEVSSVHYFDRFHAYGIHLKHATNNFLWLTPDRSCRYFNVGERSPVVPNYSLPVMVTVNPGKGLNVIVLNALDKPDDAKQVVLVPDLPITDLKERDIVMPRPGQLLLSPTLGKERSRWMFRISMPTLELAEAEPNY